MQTKQIKKFMKKKLEFHLASSTNYIAAAAKNERIRRKLTQMQVVEAYCYTNGSKLERMTIIPSKQLVEETGKALGLPLTVMRKRLEEGQILKEALRAFYYFDFKKLESIHKEMQGLKLELTNDIFSLFTTVLRNDSHKSKPIIERCINNISNMDYFSTIAVIFLNAYHCYNNHEYKKANELIESLEDAHAFTNIFAILYHELRYKIKSKINHNAVAALSYQRALDLMKINFQSSRFHQLRLYSIEQMSEESIIKAHEAFKDMAIENMDHRTKNHYFYLDLKLKFKRFNMFDSNIFDYLNHNYKDSYYYQCLIIISRNCKEKVTTKIAHLFENAPEQFLLERMLYTVQRKSGESLIEYINEVAFPMAIQLDSVTYIKYFGQKLIDDKISHNRYKEAFFLERRYQSAIKKIQST